VFSFWWRMTWSGPAQLRRVGAPGLLVVGDLDVEATGTRKILGKCAGSVKQLPALVELEGNWLDKAPRIRKWYLYLS